MCYYLIMPIFWLESGGSSVAAKNAEKKPIVKLPIFP